MGTPIDQWDKDEQGWLAMKPIIDWNVAIVSSGHAVIRIEYAEQEQDVDDIQRGSLPPRWIQIGANPTQLRHLADILRRQADYLAERDRQTERPN